MTELEEEDQEKAYSEDIKNPFYDFIFFNIFFIFVLSLI